MSNWRLRDWLEDRRRDLEAREGVALPRPAVGDGAASPELGERDLEVAGISARLTAGVPEDPVDRAQRPEGAARWLLAQLLTWHRREDKSAWWRYFALMAMTDDELLEEREPLAGLSRLQRAGRPLDRVHVSFPPQDHRIGEDSDIADPRTGQSAGDVTSVDDVARTITIKRADVLCDAPPRSIVPKGVVPTGSWPRACCGRGEVAELGLTGTASRPARPPPPAPPAAGQAPGRSDSAGGRDGRRRGDARGPDDGRRRPAIQGPPGSARRTPARG